MVVKIIVPVVVTIMALVVGFLAGRATSTAPLPGPMAPKLPSPTQTPTNTSVTNPLFKTQQASFQGTITQVQGNSLQVKAENGKTGTLALSDRVVIYKFPKGSTQASASSDLKQITTGQPVSINLELFDGDYKVVSVTFLPSAK